MSHLFKPGNTLGVGEGRPRKYTDEFIEGELKALKEWMSKEDSIYLKNFAVDRKYSSQRLTEFASEHKGFSEAYQSAKEWQEGRLIQYGLFGKTKEGLTKFLLSAVHGMKEEPTPPKQEHNVYFHSTESPYPVQPETEEQL